MIPTALMLWLGACGGGGGAAVRADIAGELAGADVVPDTSPDTRPDTRPDTPPDTPDTPYRLPGGCCDGDADCKADQFCLITDGPAHGVCLDLPEEGSLSCWDAADCPSGECRDAEICPCGASCLHDMGWCLLEGCCTGDGDCAGGERCVISGGAVGVCKPDLAAGYACWDHGDCDFGLCEGAEICACGASCDAEDVPGTCTAPPEGCCTQDEDCGDLLECVFSAGFPGVCKEPTSEGLCWSAADCGYGDCTGAQVCPCDADCDMEDSEGWCTTEFPGCCFEDQHCGGDGYCVDIVGGMGVCKDPPGQGECWENADCPEGFCAGADLYGCDHDLDVEDQSGLCSDLLPGCCLSADDCGPGQVCAVPAWEDGLGVCKDPVQGHCWSDADCGGGTCDGEILCPCGAICGVADTAGVCTEP